MELHLHSPLRLHRVGLTCKNTFKCMCILHIDGCKLNWFFIFFFLQFSGLAWLIIPSSIGYFSSSFKYNSWRIFLLVCSLPSFVVAILLIFLPESPKFLLSQGDCEGALNIFRKIYHINTGKQDDFYPVSSILESVLWIM